MRAAADYMMGRYRDAHNDLAGPAFDADRHAALWRGLTEAALENWKTPMHHLEQAGAGAEALSSRLAGRAPAWPMPKRRWAWAGWTWRMRR